MDKITWLAFLAPLVVFWQSARNFIKQVLSFFIRIDTFETTDPHHFIDFMMRNGKVIKFGNVKYKKDTFWNLKDEKYKEYFFEIRPRFIILYKNWFPFILTPGADFKITYFNIKDFKVILADFTNDLHKYNDRVNNDCKSNRFYVRDIIGRSDKKAAYNVMAQESVMAAKAAEAPSAPSTDGLRFVNTHFMEVNPPIGVSSNDLCSSPPLSDSSKYYFSIEGLQVLKQVENWYNAESFFLHRQIDWRRGGLLYGKPGTGKSALVKEVSKKLGIPLYIFHLNTLSTEEFDQAVNNAEKGSIFLFEDLDNVWDLDRKNKIRYGLPFDFFINRLSGANSIKNRFIFMTTNFIERLDSALIRDGRCDFKVELPELCQDGKRFIASRILDLWPELIKSVVTNESETAAQFENKCVTLATQKYWDDSHVDKAQECASVMAEMQYL